MNVFPVEKFLPVLIAAGLCCSCAEAPDRPAEPRTLFPLTRTVEPPAERGRSIAGFELDDRVWAALNEARSNMRLLDDSGRETPFHLRPATLANQVELEETYPARIALFQELDGNRFMIQAERDPNRPAPVAIRFSSPQANFEKRVSVSASPNGSDWTVLAENAPIFDYSRHMDARNTTVALMPGPDMIFYKVIVSNVTELKTSPYFEVVRENRADAETARRETQSFLRQEFRIDRLEMIARRAAIRDQGVKSRPASIAGFKTRRDPERKETVLDFEDCRRPLVSLTVSVEDANFSRGALLQGTDSDSNENWRDVAAGTLRRIEAGETRKSDMTLRFDSERRHRRYRLRIMDQDNPPLAVTGLQAEENVYECLFFPKPAAAYSLHYGGGLDQPPRYDVATVLAAAGRAAASPWTLGPEQTNPLYAPAPARPAGIPAKRLFMFAVLLMAAVLAAVTARLARRI